MKLKKSQRIAAIASLMTMGLPACTPETTIADTSVPTTVVNQAALDSFQDVLIASNISDNPNYAGAYVDKSTGEPVIAMKGSSGVQALYLTEHYQVSKA